MGGWEEIFFCGYLVEGDLSPKQASPNAQPPSQGHFFARADGWKVRLHVGFMTLKGVCFAEDKEIVIIFVGIRSQIC